MTYLNSQHGSLVWANLVVAFFVLCHVHPARSLNRFCIQTKRIFLFTSRSLYKCNWVKICVGYGEINPTRKWNAYLLLKLCETWSMNIVERITLLSTTSTSHFTYQKSRMLFPYRLFTKHNLWQTCRKFAGKVVTSPMLLVKLFTI